MQKRQVKKESGFVFDITFYLNYAIVDFKNIFYYRQTQTRTFSTAYTFCKIAIKNMIQIFRWNTFARIRDTYFYRISGGCNLEIYFSLLRCVLYGVINKII